MSKTKAAGAAKRTVNVAGKRRGLKAFGGEFVKAGSIIVRQVGTKFYPGRNVDMGRDFTIFATTDGYVNFRRMTGHKRNKKYVDVVIEMPAAKTTTQAATAPKAEKAPAKAKTTETKKPAAKKTTATKKEPAAKKSTKKAA